jgi:hypothetical protein
MITFLVEDGWYYLGPAANNCYSQGSHGVVVKPASGTRVLAPIDEWEMVWNDSGSGRRNDYALWRGFPAPADRKDFIVIGGFFVRSHNAPTLEDTRGMMAVHKDVLITVSPGREIWNDAGTKARRDGAVWEISTDGHLQGLSTGAFVPVDGHNKPPRATYALDRNRIEDQALNAVSSCRSAMSEKGHSCTN